MSRAIIPDSTGLATVEFALLAPVLLFFMTLLIQGARMEWTRQVLEEIASNTARCMAIGNAACDSEADARDYARSRGASESVPLTGATIDVSASQSCNGVGGMARVSITLPYGTLAGLIGARQMNLNATACSIPIT